MEPEQESAQIDPQPLSELIDLLIPEDGQQVPVSSATLPGI